MASIADLRTRVVATIDPRQGGRLAGGKSMPSAAARRTVWGMLTWPDPNPAPGRPGGRARQRPPVVAADSADRAGDGGCRPYQRHPAGALIQMPASRGAGEPPVQANGPPSGRISDVINGQPVIGNPHA